MRLSVVRTISFGLMVLILLLAVSATSYFITPQQTASAVTPPDSCFAFNAGMGMINDYYNYEGNNNANPACPRNVDIPSTIGGISVTRIGFMAFHTNQLTAVTIPSSVTTIDPASFVNNQLTSITIPSSVITIGSSAFSGNQFSTITIPSSVTNIGTEAFYGNQLTSVTIQGNPTTLGSNIFRFNKVPIASISYNGTVYTAPTGPQTPVDMCMSFNTGTGTITDYYYADLLHIKNNGSACLATEVIIPSTIGGFGVTTIGSYAFASKLLASVTIPSSVTTIGSDAFISNQLTGLTLPNSVTSVGDWAFAFNQLTSVALSSSMTSTGSSVFYRNQLTALTIPSSVTTIGSSAFYANQLTSVTIPNSVTSISDFSFYGNKLTTVTVPNSVTSINPSAFSVQSQWGGDIDTGANSAPDFWSSDSAEVQQAYDSIWYVRLYTADPTNPNNLVNDILGEDWWWGDDANANGINDSLGGHIINPASLDLAYVNQADTSLQTTQTFTGELLPNDYLNNYFVTQGPVMPIPADSMSPTPSEQQAIDDAFAVYYRIGDSVTITPPVINGYITPPTQTFVLGAATNEFSYVYEAQSSSGGSGGELAETGINEGLVLASSVFLLAAGMYPLIRRFA